ncbi:response regulator [Clostridioides difficile]|jgi:virR two-component response regulator virR|uniref:LytR/AlgR family response regulator transcription factor n=1 Tax=Alloscardovia omnicolens TaxID=419015 RepID=UPI000410EC36|nr:response regulator [Alloscardovia omnicolens]EGT4752590.1 response regulator [Clostridioides difficile]KWZ72852.1 response regulator receiver domain protein [Alloscardovia omnicolens]MBS6347013.1 response regulator [Alloscardovia omnicolens]MDK8082082.1 response regulator [Alloscardovia omnicolens]
MRLALVDDDAEIRSLLRAYVQRYNTEYGTSISTYDFTRGSDLLHNYERGVFDVIFLDIEMPGINGMETATQIRRIDDAVALVFVTHLAQFAVQGYEVQASDYIIKPLSYFDFAMKITRILKTIEGENKYRSRHNYY